MAEAGKSIEATPAATVLLLRERDGLKVLMIKRGDDGFYGPALVFPGGKVEPADLTDDWGPLVSGADQLDRQQRALRIAAWRELFEEVGLLPEGWLDRIGADLATLQALDFIEVVRRAGVPLPLGGLEPLARWVTPHFAPKRFDTYFFLCALEGDAVCDGYEAEEAEWVSPAEALALAEAGKRRLLFPTMSQLSRLAGLNTIADAFANARAFPCAPIMPAREQRGDGVFLTIPLGYGYPVTEHDITAATVR